MKLVRLPGNRVTKGQWFFSTTSALGRLCKGVVCFYNKRGGKELGTRSILQIFKTIAMQSNIKGKEKN